MSKSAVSNFKEQRPASAKRRKVSGIFCLLIYFFHEQILFINNSFTQQLFVCVHIIDLKRIQYLNATIEWNSNAWLHTNYFCIITIQTISVRPTKVDLNTHDIRLRQIYFHLTLLIRCFMLTLLIRCFVLTLLIRCFVLTLLIRCLVLTILIRYFVLSLELKPQETFN